MVEERIYNWIALTYGEVSPIERNRIANTFELYWDEFTFWYAEIKTLEIHKPQTR
jgi:hypothetical protein